MEIDRKLTTASNLVAAKDQELGFGNVFSDHMLVRDWADGEWGRAMITPRQPIPVEPSALGIHYGQSVFEGLKAYRGSQDGVIRLFRPDRNAARLKASSERLCIPTLPAEEFLECIQQLVATDSTWVPKEREHALYVRPMVFASEGHLSVRPAQCYKLVITTAPVAPYFSSRSRALRLKAESRFTRAASGGTGSAKTSGNYAPTLWPMASAAAEGFDQILWLDAQEHTFAEEAGQMNIFFRIGDEVVTPELSGTILPGVTRESALKLLEDWGVNAGTRRISMEELARASEDGSLLEIFGAGTAAVIASVASISYLGKEISAAPPSSGSLAERLREELLGIQYGERQDPHNWTHVVG
jgi:branched-chain amino acid aminotransferase|tara:strand:+ start:7854 stop:8921 length:1068 start_codon:yes stop_codon:yes gene_type:complete